MEAQLNLPFKLLQILRVEPEDVTRIDGLAGNRLLSFKCVSGGTI